MSISTSRPSSPTTHQQGGIQDAPRTADWWDPADPRGSPKRALATAPPVVDALASSPMATSNVRQISTDGRQVEMERGEKPGVVENSTEAKIDRQERLIKSALASTPHEETAIAALVDGHHKLEKEALAKGDKDTAFIHHMVQIKLPYVHHRRKVLSHIRENEVAAFKHVWSNGEDIKVVHKDTKNPGKLRVTEFDKTYGGPTGHVENLKNEIRAADEIGMDYKPVSFKDAMKGWVLRAADPAEGRANNRNAWVIRAPDPPKEDRANYPHASSEFSKLSIRDHVPNMDSIGAGLTNYSIHKGIRHVPIAHFAHASVKDLFYAADDHRRVKNLTSAINESREINPLIVAVDNEGPYLIEGCHRLAALHALGETHVPAVVVSDFD